MDIVKKLHPLEKRVVSVLRSNRNVEDIIKNSGLKEVEVIRALQWLKNKGVLKVNIGVREKISLGRDGKRYLKEGLPERILLNLLKVKPLRFTDIKLDKDEASGALGVLKSRGAIISEDGVLRLSEKGKGLLNESLGEEDFIYELSKNDKYIDELVDKERIILNELRRRKDIIRIDIVKERSIELTKLGCDLVKKDLKIDLLENVNSELIRSGVWKRREFRAYDLKVDVPKIYPGKRHFVNQAIDYARRIWLDMGFKEMKGSIIQTSFWNFDALFVPQDHPARELQDSYFLDKEGRLPDKELINKIRKAHESGVSGSKGWQYKWDEEDAKKLVLRTHTTVLSAQILARLKKEELPVKYFAIGRNYRNEALDWSHLFEFNQTEGIVVDENANFRHLLGYLKEFFRKMGFEKARFRPAYFPYTEPSVEIDVYHPIYKKWIELGGAGIFRPEVVVPLLGKDIPVLAWGPGFDRIIMDYYKIKDIRELYKNDIKQLRRLKVWMK